MTKFTDHSFGIRSSQTFIIGVKGLRTIVQFNERMRKKVVIFTINYRLLFILKTVFFNYIDQYDSPEEETLF